jgi:plastocyanin
MKTTILLFSLLLAGSGAQAADVTVTTKDKTFSVKALTLKVGDKVTFRNEDPFSHNVFSLTEPGSFDLGTYSKGESRSVEIKEAGVHEVECAIHPEMKLVITANK